MSNISTHEVFEPMYAALRELGLTENEQRFYVLSLQNGPMSITGLAEQMGLPRPNLYKIMEGLKAKGLLDIGARNRHSRRLVVEAPSKVSELLRKKRDEQLATDRSFIEQLPMYLAQFRQGDGPMKMKVLVGQKDFVRAFNQIFEETTTELWYFGSVTELSEAVGRSLIDQNVGQRVARKIRTKALMLPVDREYLSAKQHENQMREVRYLETVPPFVTSFHVFANKVIFWQPRAPMAVLIEDEYIVAMMRSIFSALWEQGVK